MYVYGRTYNIDVVCSYVLSRVVCFGRIFISVYAFSRDFCDKCFYTGGGFYKEKFILF